MYLTTSSLAAAPAAQAWERHLKTLDSFSARHWALPLRAEPNGLPTNNIAKQTGSERHYRSLDNVKHQLKVNFKQTAPRQPAIQP